MKKRKQIILIVLIVIVAILIFTNLPEIMRGAKAGWNSK
jgi:hypothetical protein